MQRLNNHRHRKPDFLLVLIAVVGLALAATLAIHVHALSDSGVPGVGQTLSQSRFSFEFQNFSAPR